jgi:hypothetical protein
MAKSGDICTNCFHGQLYAYDSKPCGDSQKRYLKCNNCGKTAGKSVVLAESIRRRIRFTNERIGER